MVPWTNVCYRIWTKRPISPAEVKSYVQKLNVECNSVAIDLNPSMKPEVDTRFHQIFLKNGRRVHTAHIFLDKPNHWYQ